MFSFISSVFHVVFYNPLYNGLVFLLSLFPHFDVGIAVIIFTIIIKLILFPLSRKAVKTQMAIKEIEPQLALIKTEFATDKQRQAVETMALYKKNGINPLSGIATALIQTPILIALYLIFYKSGLPVIDTHLLYSFITAPINVSMNFLGLIDISKSNIALGALAAISQYFSASFSIPPRAPKQEGVKPTFADDLSHSLSIQAKYVFPAIIFFISFKVSGALCLYWIVSNLFIIGQELYLRQHRKLILAK